VIQGRKLARSPPSPSKHELAGPTSHAARYLHAQCCIKLGKLNEAREVLTNFGELEVGIGG